MPTRDPFRIRDTAAQDHVIAPGGALAARGIPRGWLIGGLAGADLTVATFHRVIAETRALLERPAADEPVWLNAKD